jgi:hypothetical protein
MISNDMLFTGFLCGCVGGVSFSVKYFPVIFSFVFNSYYQKKSNRAEFIVKYSASDLVIIFMFLL